MYPAITHLIVSKTLVRVCAVASSFARAHAKKRHAPDVGLASQSSDTLRRADPTKMPQKQLSFTNGGLKEKTTKGQGSESSGRVHPGSITTSVQYAPYLARYLGLQIGLDFSTVSARHNCTE